MDGNILRQIEVEDIVFFTDNQYDPKNRKKYLEVFEDMVARGHLTGNFSGMKWMGYSGVKRYGIDFSLDERAYNMHFGKRFGIPYLKMQDMLRCYVIYNIGAFIFPTISEKVGWVKQQLVEYIADTRDGGDTKIDIDKLFLDTHTGAVRFKQASDKVAKEAELKWRRHRNTQTTC